MSGHSKWATTKRQKFATDAKRSALFTKLANNITVASRTGGGVDPETNFKLRLAIDKARAASMPKENIERAINRGSGKDGVNHEEIIYEAIMPLESAGAGVAIIISTLTDNKNRTVSDLRSTLTKHNARMVSAGSITYLFDQVGEIIASKSSNQLPKDELELIIIDSGAEDYLEEEEDYKVYTTIADLPTVQKTLTQAGVTVESSEIIYRPKSIISLSELDQEKAEHLFDALDDLEDVGEIYTNI